MLNSVGRHRHGPLLTRINLRQGAGRLPPSAPIKLSIRHQCPNLGVGESFGVFTGTSFFPEMVDGPWPTAFRERFDADLCIQDVLPKSVNIVRIWHQRTKSNDGNGFERPLLKPFTGFAVLRGQCHSVTSIHDALGNHGDGVPCINVDALTGHAGSKWTGQPQGRPSHIVLIDVPAERSVGLNVV